MSDNKNLAALWRMTRSIGVCAHNYWPPRETSLFQFRFPTILLLEIPNVWILFCYCFLWALRGRFKCASFAMHYCVYPDKTLTEKEVPEKAVLTAAGGTTVSTLCLFFIIHSTKCACVWLLIALFPNTAWSTNHTHKCIHLYTGTIDFYMLSKYTGKIWNLVLRNV